MVDPRLLGPGAVDIPSPENHWATILDDAIAPGQEVRVIVPSNSEQFAEDPMPWAPYVTAAGVFYPKRDDRAVVTFPIDGPPVISQWWPESASPDVSF